MLIFIRRLPASTSRMDLRRFVSNALQPRWYQLEFESLGQLISCDIFRVCDKKSSQSEFHGIVDIEPAKTAMQVIERLNGEHLHSKPMLVRKFYCRSLARDRRVQLGPTPTYILEKRRITRRRQNLKFAPLHAGTTYLEPIAHHH